MTFVRQMLDLKSKFDKIITESFRNEKKMQKKLKDAFEEFVNLDARCASYLASYLDEQLKRYYLFDQRTAVSIYSITHPFTTPAFYHTAFLTTPSPCLSNTPFTSFSHTLSLLLKHSLSLPLKHSLCLKVAYVA